MIVEWWAALSVAMKIIWGVTLTASLIFLVELVLTFIGADIDADIPDDIDLSNTDMASPGSNLYTFRNLVNFILGFGWSMILLQDQIKSTTLHILISIGMGIGLVALVMYMFRLLSKMQQNGAIILKKSAVNCQGKVYLTIPGERKGSGKVQISINDSVREYDAITDCDTIVSGTPIKVTEVIDNNTLLVESTDSLII